jgi:hypothetical protein
MKGRNRQGDSSQIFRKSQIIQMKIKWPIFAIIALFIFTFFMLLLTSLNTNQGRFIYPLDDTYIHLSLAEKFSGSGIWGISEDGFASSSSSLLWSLILSGIFAVFGASALIPLILSVLFTLMLLIYTDHIFKKYKFTSILNFLGLLTLFLLTPLSPLAFSGLEHAVHSLLVILMLCVSGQILSQDKKPAIWKLICLAPLLIMARFESIMFVFVIAVLFLLKKRWKHFLALLTGGIPLAIFGFISLQQGWFFLPNSILLKGRTPDFTSLTNFGNWLTSPWMLSRDNFHILLLLILLAIIQVKLLVKSKSYSPELTFMNFILIMTMILHIQFAQTGWFYRYEAYLMISGLFIVVLFINEHFHSNLHQAVNQIKNHKPVLQFLKICIPSLIVFFALSPRAVNALKNIPQASKNIYEQQYQMSLFLKTYYDDSRITANDIGAINYFTDTDCFDLWGLSSFEVAKAKLQNSFDVEFIDQITKSKQIKIAMLYEHWFAPYGGLPPEWIKVGEWTIQNNVVCGGNTVSFFAVDPSEKELLTQHLLEFSSKLPADVIHKIGAQLFE